MADLKACPTYIEQTREYRIIKILKIDILTAERFENRRKAENNGNQPKNVPRCPFSLVDNHLPNLLLYLSERTPTKGVAIPSQSCPKSSAYGAAVVWTTVVRKKSR